MRKIQEIISFLKEFKENPQIVGALTPSSPFVSKAIAERIYGESKINRRILEIGAGDGAVSKRLIEKLKPGDHLDLIECVPKLVEKLRVLIEKSGKKSQIGLYGMYIEDFQVKEKYDNVISGLPLTFFPPETVKLFYEKIDNELLKPDGMHSFYEYYLVPKFRHSYYKVSGKKEEYARLKAIFEIKQGYLSNKTVEESIIWLNLPPMRVCHVR